MRLHLLFELRAERSTRGSRFVLSSDGAGPRSELSLPCSRVRWMRAPGPGVPRILRDAWASFTRRFPAAGAKPPGANVLAPKVVCQEVISRAANWFKRVFARRGVYRSTWAAGIPSAKPSSKPSPRHSRPPLHRGATARARGGPRPGGEYQSPARGRSRPSRL